MKHSQSSVPPKSRHDPLVMSFLTLSGAMLFTLLIVAPVPASAQHTYNWQDLGNNGTREMTGVVIISDAAFARATVTDADITSDDLFLEFQMPYETGRLQTCSSEIGDDLRGVNIVIEALTGHLSGTFGCSSASTHLRFNYDAGTGEWFWSRGVDEGRGLLSLAPPPAQDIVFAVGEHRSYLLRNEGNRTFTQGAQWGVSSPISSDVGDLNGDGYTDIVSSSRFTPSKVCMNIGDGSGTYVCDSLYHTAGTNADAVAVFDADGLNGLDVLYIPRVFPENYVCFNDGSGNLSCEEIVGVPSTHRTLATWGDIEPDGDIDFALGGFRTGDVDVCLNQGDGRTYDCQSLGVGANSELEFIDIDGDEDLDIVLSHWADQPPRWCEWNAGTHDPCQLLPTTNGGNSQAIGDFDEDGIDDVFLTDTENSPAMCFGNTQQQFVCDSAPYSGLSLDSWGGHGRAGDADGDGHLDVVIATRSFGTRIGYGRGDATFEWQDLTAGETCCGNGEIHFGRVFEPPEPACADADGDGYGIPGDASCSGGLNTDLCPGTVSGNEVDTNGCSDAQVDGDGDGICDPGAPSNGPSACTGWDNCTDVVNPGQSDQDGDTEGDACDDNDLTAVCQALPVDLVASAVCRGTASASAFNDASFDYDLDTLTFVVAPASPYALGGPHPVTLTVDDMAPGNPDDAQETCDAQVTVVDETRPVITLDGASAVSLECALDSYSEEGATAVDNCDADFAATVGGDIVNEAVPALYVVTYDASDAAANAANQVSKNVTVSDTIAPTITLLGDAAPTIQCGVDNYTEAEATASDSCDPSVPVTIGGATPNPAVVGLYNVTYDASDDSLNPAPRVIRPVTVVDTIAPVLTTCPPDRELLADPISGLAPVPDLVPEAVAFDACNLAVSQDVAAGTFLGAGSHTVTLAASDGIQTDDCTVTLTVLDRLLSSEENVKVHFHGQLDDGAADSDSEGDSNGARCFTELDLDGELTLRDAAALPIDVREALTAVEGRLVVSLAGVEIADQTVVLEVKDPDKEKWEYKRSGDDPDLGLKKIKLDWTDQAEYDSHAGTALGSDVPRIETRFIGFDETDIKMSFKDVARPFTVVLVNGGDEITVTVQDDDGNVDITPQPGSYELEDKKDSLEMVLPFRLTPETLITFTDSLDTVSSIPVDPEFNYAVASAKYMVEFDKTAISDALCGPDPLVDLNSLSNPTLDIEIRLGSNLSQVVGSVDVDPADWTKLDGKHWEVKP